MAVGRAAPLVALRVLQGAGAAVIFPVGIAAISNPYPDTKRARALGLVFAIANLGTVLGPFVGGSPAGGPGRRWIFSLLTPVCAGALVVATATMSDSQEPHAARRPDSSALD